MSDIRKEKEELNRRLDALLEDIERRFEESKACKEAVEASPFANEEIAPVPYEMYEKMFGGMKLRVNELRKELNSDE